MNVAVVGGGVFGCSAAWMLAREGHRVTLYERAEDVLTCASAINQYRLHKGYHYPRSDETAYSSIEGQVSFVREYGEAVVEGADHYYAVAKEGSLVDAHAYLAFCERVGLDYEIADCPVLRPEMLQLSIRAKEALFDPDGLRRVVREKIVHHGVRIVHEAFEFDRRDDFDRIVYALYAASNAPFEDRVEFQRPYQFELCEKPVVALPEIYHRTSVVVMDGPFMCIDPLGYGGTSVMGNVVHAIHQRSVGLRPEPPEEYVPLLNRGVVPDPQPTRFPEFLAHAEEFFIGLEACVHVGSMYTYRTVPPNRDADDGRPTLVEPVTDREIRLFSGKIGTCVDAAERVCRLLEG